MLCALLVLAYRLAAQGWDSPIARMLARLSVADWLDHIRADQKTRALNRAAGFFLADPEELSLLTLVDELASDMPGGRFYRSKGGNDHLATRLAARFGEQVCLRTTLLAATQTRNRVRVTARAAGELHLPAVGSSPDRTDRSQDRRIADQSIRSAPA